MAFKKYKIDVLAADVFTQLGRTARDIVRSMVIGEDLNQQWKTVIEGLTDAQIAQQLFGAQTQAELDKVTDIKQAFSAIGKINRAMDGDATVVIPPTANSWYVRLREFA